VLKIEGQEFKTPQEFMDYINRKDIPDYVNDPKYVNRVQRTMSTVFVETGYGWFWIDDRFSVCSTEFFLSRKAALDDLLIFQSKN
jgi:hypothetical protein